MTRKTSLVSAIDARKPLYYLVSTHCVKCKGRRGEHGEETPPHVEGVVVRTRVGEEYHTDHYDQESWNLKEASYSFVSVLFIKIIGSDVIVLTRKKKNRCSSITHHRRYKKFE